ncbi:MAG: AMP-dependent synthetase/ligase [Thainema sp.]
MIQAAGSTPLRGRSITEIKNLTNYREIQSIPEMWPIAASQYGNITALHDPHSEPEIKFSYAELSQAIQQFAAALQALGIQANDHISLFSENCPRWMVADQGIMTAGAADAVRGALADRDELLYIYSHSDSVALVVQDKATLDKLQPQLTELSPQFVVLLTDEAVEPDTPFKLLNFTQFMELGANQSVKLAPRQPSDLATLMYTSGTSGQPKGVMLTHGNLLSQVFGASEVVQPNKSDRILSILPIWHSYERSFEYFTLSWGITQIYTNIRHVKKDLQTFKPRYMVGVPRLWESIYEGVQKQFREQPAKKQKLIHFFLNASQQYIEARRTANNVNLNRLHPSQTERMMAGLKASFLGIVHGLGDKMVYQKVRNATGGNIDFLVSGGGSLAEHLEDFFEIINVTILGGYGLTETSPITNVRRPWRNLRSADGQPLPNTEILIVDPETRKPVPNEQQGLVLIRGPQVMKGYYKNPEATQKVLDPDGWFDSGDLGWVTDQQDLIITGRAKDTIVLTNGENIEPQPIENACARSAYIDQIMLVGQDQRSLGALVVPNLEALQQWAHQQNLHVNLPEQPASDAPAGMQVIELDSKPVRDLIRQELTHQVKNRPGYRPDDRIGPFCLLAEPFSIENGMLTRTLKVRRQVVNERYRGMIDGMFS